MTTQIALIRDHHQMLKVIVECNPSSNLSADYLWGDWSGIRLTSLAYWE